MKIGIFGVSGRMGRAIAAAAMDDPAVAVVSAVSRSATGRDVGELLGRERSGVIVCREPVIPLPDVFIDFSLPEGLKERLAARCPMVIGTTGLSPSDWAMLEEAAKQTPLFWAPNFSVGMALLRRFARELATALPSSHIDLVESHHAQKKDAPSGSAIGVAEAIREAAPAADVRIHSIRSGAIVGKHSLQFNTPEERIEIIHEAHSRTAFAKGALGAARFLTQQPPGLYGMDDLLNHLY